MDTIGPVDYVVITLSFLVSTLIGVYFGFCGDGQKTSNTYFLGDRKMKVLPVSASLVVSVMSAIAYLGTPAEIYMTGPKYSLFIVGRFISALFVTTIFLPCFYRLNITSVYEYLERRFNKLLRYSVICCIATHSLVYLGIVMYTPALALSTVTGLGLPGSILSVGVVCTFYTTIGGFKAVIWTDVFQSTIMTLSLIIMIIVGCITSGGPGVGWERANYGQRSELVDFHIDPTRVYTFWSLLIGGSVFNMSIFAVGQSFVQRYNSCRSESDAKKVAWLGISGTAFIDLLGVMMGMVLYSTYAFCDPVTSGTISRPDQILPYFIMDVFGRYPGLPGFFIAGAFCASLSSVSSIVNSLSAITGQDIIKVIKKDITESQYALAIKICSGCFGILGIIIAFLASVMGRVLETALRVAGVLQGPAFGIFCLGMVVPRAHSKGAFCGFLVSVIFGIILFIGSELSVSSTDGLPLYTYGCQDIFNDTDDLFTTSQPLLTQLTQAEPDQLNILNLSFLYYAFVTSFLTICLGYLSSIFMSNPDLPVERETISPLILEKFPFLLAENLKYDIANSNEEANL